MLAAAMVVTLLQVVSPAHASNWGSICEVGPPAGCVSLANNNQHVLNWEGDEDIPGMQAAHGWARDNVYNPTDLHAYTNAADSLPDVRVWDEPYGNNGAVGWVDCPSNNTGTGGSHPNRWCRGQILRYNSSYTTTQLYTEALRRRVACHEIGHTAGVNHETNALDTCMNPAWIVPTQTNLNNHDRSHINSYY